MAESRIPTTDREKRKSFLPQPKTFTKVSSSSSQPSPQQQGETPSVSQNQQRESPTPPTVAESNVKPPQENDSVISSAPTLDLKVGDYVCISGKKCGVLRYYGRTHFVDGTFCGIELNEPEGKHDGEVGGVRYFTCRPMHGIFAPRSKVSALPSETQSVTDSSSETAQPQTETEVRPSDGVESTEETPLPSRSRLIKPRSIPKGIYQGKRSHSQSPDSEQVSLRRPEVSEIAVADTESGEDTTDSEAPASTSEPGKKSKFQSRLAKPKTRLPVSGIPQKSSSPHQSRDSSQEREKSVVGKESEKTSQPNVATTQSKLPQRKLFGTKSFLNQTYSCEESSISDHAVVEVDTGRQPVTDQTFNKDSPLLSGTVSTKEQESPCLITDIKNVTVDINNSNSHRETQITTLDKTYEKLTFDTKLHSQGSESDAHVPDLSSILVAAVGSEQTTETAGGEHRKLPGELNLTYDTGSVQLASPIPDLLTPSAYMATAGSDTEQEGLAGSDDPSGLSVLKGSRLKSGSSEGTASTLDNSLQFLKGSRLLTEESQLGILKTDELNQTNLLAGGQQPQEDGHTEGQTDTLFKAPPSAEADFTPPIFSSTPAVFRIPSAPKAPLSMTDSKESKVVVKLYSDNYNDTGTFGKQNETYEKLPTPEPGSNDNVQEGDVSVKSDAKRYEKVTGGTTYIEKDTKVTRKMDTKMTMMTDTQENDLTDGEEDTCEKLTEIQMDLVDDIDQECHDLEGQGHITEDEEAEMLSSMEKEYIAQTQRLSEEETMDEEEEEGNSEPKLLTPVTEESETDSLKKDTVEQLPLDIQLEKKTGDIMVDSGLAQSVHSEGGLEVRGRGKERPLSMISVSSVDTGYQPDTDSDAGLLSPVGWSESRSLASGHHLLPAGGGVGGHISDAMSTSQMTQADGLMSLSQISQPDVMMMSSLDGLERGDGSLRDSTFTAATSSNVHGDHDLELAQSDIDELKVTGASSELEMKKETSDTESQHDLALEQEELAQMLSTEEAITEDEIVSVPNNETEQEPLQIDQGLALNLDLLEDNENTEAHPASLDVTLQETEEDGETTQDEGVATAPETDTEHAALDMREREKGPDQVEDTDTEQREGTQEKEQLSKKKTSVTKKPSPGKLDGKRKEELAKPKRTSSPRNKKTPEKSELKKPNTKVGSRLADYIHKPVAEKSNDKSKDAVDSKLKKNASNKQKIEGREIAKTQSEDKKSFRRSPTPKKEEPKKIIKKAPVKNKWDNIMSQLEASKEQDKHKPKSEVKSKLAPMIEASPVTTHSPAAKNSPRARSGSNEKRASTPKADYTKVKSRIDTHSSVPIQKRKVSPRLSAGLTKERRESTGSQMSSTRSSRSDLNASVIESKQEKPSNKLTQNLKNEEKSLSRTSINSDTSQMSTVSVTASVTSSQGSVTKQGRNHDNGSSSAVAPQKRRSLIVPPSKTSPAESRRGASTTASSGKTAPKTAGKKTETGPQSPATSNKKPLNQNKNRTVRSVVSLKPSSANQPDVVKHSLTRSRANAAQEISRLEALCEQRTKELNLLKLELKASLLGFDAMTVTVRYLTEELDGFSCPRIAAQLKDTQESLAQAQAEIAELKQDKCHLQDEVISLTKQHEEKVDSMKAHHTKTVQNLQQTAEEDKEREVQRIIDQHSHEVTTQRAYHERRVAELTAEYDQKLKEVQDKNQDILEQIKIEQQEQIQELQRNHELRLEEITNKFEDIKSSLLNKVETLRLECEEMRERTKEYEEALQRDSDVKVALALAPYNHLPAEIDSLKTVIEMRNMEIHDLRRHNLEQSKQLEELQIAKEKNIALEQKIENLEAIINIKSDYEKQLSEKHQVLMRRYDRESKANKRLSMDKEELVWRISNSDLSQSVDFGSSGNVRRQISRSPTSSEPGTPDGSRRHARKSPLSTSPAGSDFICSPTHRTSHKRRSGSHMSDDHSRPTSSASEMDEERDDLKFQTM